MSPASEFRLCKRKSRHPLFRTWESMIRRCHKPTHHGYRWYGARGVTVCERWRSDFWLFVRDMGARPEGRTLDRIDGNGNYEPGNCRWATQEQQSNNRRPCVVLRGSQAYGCKLNELKVLEIRRRASHGERVVGLASDFGVSVSLIYAVLQGKKWRHV